MLKTFATTSLAFVLVTASCGGEGDSGAPADRTGAAAVTTEPARGTVDGRRDAPSTGTLIGVKMITDDQGNRFEPAAVEARPGDVIRFTLASGVHNVSFGTEESAGKGGLPPASDYLQLPGQTYDLKVELAPGEYTFQCDPHAALGMVGILRVKQ